jgi:3-deoxy-D-manno-octulosonic-acid transferase
VLDALRPELLLVMETEIWPNLIREARRRGVRVAIVNGRISPRSYPRYLRIRWFLRRVLADVDLMLMQAEPHAARALAIGAPPSAVRAVGNLKFDLSADPAPPAALQALFAGVAGAPIWVAGSTMAGEEPQVLAAYRRLLERVPDTLLVLVPRHPERCSEVAASVQAAGFEPLLRSRLTAGGWRRGEVLVVDTLGELAALYAFARAVFVGGSLVATGGHNVLEPAAAGRAIVVGPHMANFQEIADAFAAAGAFVQVRDAEELARATAELMADAARRDALGEKARALVAANRGAVERTLDALAPLLA